MLRRVVPIGALAIAVLPIVWVSVDFVRSRKVLYAPDMFQTLLASMAAGHGEQYQGAWSRIGISHLGPAWFYWAAPFAWAFDDHPSSMVLAAGALAVASSAVLVSVVARGSGAAASCLVAGVLLIGFMQLSLLGVVAPWNPTILIVPAAAGLACAADAWARGSLPSVAGAVVLGALVAQSHLGAIVLGMAIAASALVGVVWSRRLSGRPLPSGRLALVALIAVVPWVPVMIDQAVGTGNAAAVATYATVGTINGRTPDYREGSSRHLDAAESLRHLASITFLVEPDVGLWAGIDVPAGRTHQPSRRSWVVGLFVVAAATAFARPTRGWPKTADAPGAWLCRAGLVGLACQTAATLQVRDEFRGYLVAASAGVGLALWSGIAVAGLAWARRFAPERLVPALPAACAAVLVLSAFVAYPRVDWRIHGDPLPPRAASTFDTLTRLTGSTPIKIHVGTARLLPTYFTFTWELEQRGVRVSVRGMWSARFSDRQQRGPFTGREVLLRDPDAPPRADCTDVGRYRSVVLCLRR